MFFRSVSRFMPDHTAWQPTRRKSSQWPLWEPQMSHSKYWQAESHFLYICLEMMHEFDTSNLYLIEQSVRLTLRRHANWRGRYGSNPTIHILNFSSRCEWPDSCSGPVSIVMRLSLIYSRSQTWCRRGKSLFLTEINSLLYSAAHSLSLQSCWWASSSKALQPIQGLSKRFEHLLWPPRSPDLTPCDFFLWGYVKDNAYKPQTARSHSSCGANHWWEQVS